MSGTRTPATKAAVRGWAAVAQWGAVWVAVLAIVGGVGGPSPAAVLKELAVAAAPAACGSVAILAGPVVNPANGHRYYLLEPASWPAAEAEAVCLGGHLVTINDNTENTWVWSEFSHYGGVERYLYMGFSDAASEGTWVWISGEPVTFTHWAPGQPDGGSEDCGEVYPDGWWHDASCEVTFENGVVETQCGNGVPQPDWGEECDDGNTNPSDGCTNACTICGNVHKTPPEECDDGNLNDGDGCDSNCTLPRCGNSIVDAGEECDDGNTINADACRNDCRPNVCWPLGCVVGNGTPASCTEAALDAALAGGGTVTFDCGAAPVTLTITSTKVIAQDTTLDGGGRITISGGGAVRVLAVEPSAGFNVLNLTVSDGSAGLPDFAEDGGGIYNSGTLTVTNSIIANNSARHAGGGILSEGTLTVSSSTFSGNRAGPWCGSYVPYGFGGGIAVTHGQLIVTNSTFVDNSGCYGGGISNLGGAEGSSLTVANSTFAGNSAERSGAGIYADPQPATVTNSIIANSIGSNCAGEIVDGGHNFQWPGTDCGQTIPTADPLLDPDGLQNNGGPTETIALLDGSPAIDSGDPEVCANPPVNGLDQRGFVRPGPGSVACSIGAFEYYPAPTATPTATPSLTPTATTRPSEGGDGGCTVTPTGRGGAVWWGALPLWLLLRVQRRRGHR